MDVRIGTVDLPDRMEREHYFKELDFLELSAMFAGPINSAILTKWAAVIPRDTVGLVAPFVLTHRQPPKGTKLWAHDLAVGDFRDSGLGRVALGQFGDALVKLRARCAVFRSPSLFAASQANRDALTKFFAEIATPQTVGGARVWIPDGLWDARTAVKFATELGVTCAIDPLAREPGQPLESFMDFEAPSLYFRITGLGQALSAEKQDDLAALIEHYQAIPLTIAFDSPSRWQDARSLKSLLREEAPE